MWKEEHFLNKSLVANMRKMEVSSLVVRGYETKLWKTIGKYWDTFYNRSSFVVGNGRRVKFWKNKWCGDELLCVFVYFSHVVVI